MGAARPDVADGYRCLPEGKHLIFYRIDGDMVRILGVPHASMDIDRHLDSELPDIKYEESSNLCTGLFKEHFK